MHERLGRYRSKDMGTAFRSPPPPQLRGRQHGAAMSYPGQARSGRCTSLSGQEGSKFSAAHRYPPPTRKKWVYTVLQQFCLSYSIYQSMYIHIHIKAKCSCIKIAWRCCNTQEESLRTILHLKHQLHLLLLFPFFSFSKLLYLHLISIWYENKMKSR